MIEQQKQRLFLDNQYTYHPVRMVYFNRTTKKAFSREYIDDNDLRRLSISIREVTPQNEWKFYFNKPPKEHVSEELIRELS